MAFKAGIRVESKAANGTIHARIFFIAGTRFWSSVFLAEMPVVSMFTLADKVVQLKHKLGQIT